MFEAEAVQCIMNIYYWEEKRNGFLARSNSLDCKDEIIKFGPCDFFYNLAVLENLESRNNFYPKLLCQWLLAIKRYYHIRKSVDLCKWMCVCSRLNQCLVNYMSSW